MSDLGPYTYTKAMVLLAHLSRRLKSELIVYLCSGVRRRRCRRQPFSNMNTSEASRPIAINFYLKHHWGEGKERLHGVLVQISLELWFPWQHIAPIELLWEKRRHHVFSKVYDRILFILSSNDDMHEGLDEFEIWPDSTTDYGVSCP